MYVQWGLDACNRFWHSNYMCFCLMLTSFYHLFIHRLIFFELDTMNMCNQGLVHIKQISALCPNVVIMDIFVIILIYFHSIYNVDVFPLV